MPAAMGSGSNLANSSLTGRPSSSSTAADDFFVREGPDVLLQPRQFFDHVEAGSGRARVLKHLAELDERGPQVLQRPAEAPGPRFVMFRNVRLPQDHAAAPPQVAIELELRHDVAKAVLEEDGGNLAAAAEIAEESKRMRLHVKGFSHAGVRGSGSVGLR